MYFEHGVSNGQSSMDAVPAILASIPSWMKETFILSTYSMNQYNSLPGILKDNGYSSAFFMVLQMALCVLTHLHWLLVLINIMDALNTQMKITLMAHGGFETIIFALDRRYHEWNA